ncbi:MAG: 3-deoxy-D-manno-octulosonate 8-phosphate phosphatase [Sediminibacterium sp.]|nr:3-deoxy-D-manno-octulosonate 8-phosphate phosphatase [Sediminibacterium sp.]
MEYFQHITTFVLDVDGVLTDGSLWLMPGGTQVRKMNIRDGYALQLAIKKGYRIFIISSAVSPEVTQRLQGLGLTDIQMGVKNKAAALQEYCNIHAIQIAQVLCMGDDVPDLPMLQLAGVACCPTDAIPEIRVMAKYVSPQKGGEGCVRDVIEKVMKLRGDWSEDTEIAAR